MKKRKISWKKAAETKRKFKIAALATVLLLFVGFISFATAGVVGGLATTSIAVISLGGVELTAEQEKVHLAYMEQVKSLIDKNEKGYITETTMKTAMDAALQTFLKDSGLPNKEELGDYKKLKEQCDNMGIEILALTQNPQHQDKWKFGSAVKKALGLKETQDQVQIVARNKSGAVTLFTVFADKKTAEENVNKVVGDISTGNVTTDTGGNAILDLINSDDVRMLKLASTFVENFATVTATSKPTYTYTDVIPKEGDATWVGEAGTKQQIDFSIESRTINPKKVAGYLILSQEAYQDIPQMESMANSVLLQKIMLKRQNGFLFGTGLANDPVGVTVAAKAFDPTSWTSSLFITNPNLLDVIRACANQISTTVNWTDDMEMYPNAVFVNPGDWTAFIGTKTTFEQYVFPQFQQATPNTGSFSVDSLTVVPKTKIPAGKILIGDFSKLNIVEYIPYSVSTGLISDQFIKNQFTMLGESRVYCFVREYEERAFIYDDIANVVAGIQPIAP